MALTRVMMLRAAAGPQSGAYLCQGHEVEAMATAKGSRGLTPTQSGLKMSQ